MKKFFQKLAAYSWGVLLFAVLCVVSGVCLISFPEEVLPKVVLIISIFTIVYGIVSGAINLANRDRGVLFFFRLLGAICALFCGIFLLIKHSEGVTLLTLFVGVLVMIDSSFKLHTAILSKRYQHSMWWVMLVLSIVCLAGGLYLVKWIPTDRLKFCSVMMGIVMVLEGVQNFLTTFYTMSVEKSRKKEILEESAAETDKEKVAETKKEQETEPAKEKTAETDKDKAAEPSEASLSEPPQTKEEATPTQADLAEQTVVSESGASVTVQDAPAETATENKPE